MEHRQSTVTARPRMEGVSMSFGKMNSFIDIVIMRKTKDPEGFANLINVTNCVGNIENSATFCYNIS